MDELTRRMRERVVETLSLIASERAQRKYQREAPNVDVPAELFNQWEDCFFGDEAVFRQGFQSDEFKAIVHFNDVLNEVSRETPQQLPPLDEFVSSSSWRKMSQAAMACLRALST